jgi:hypothetical protein
MIIVANSKPDSLAGSRVSLAPGVVVGDAGRVGKPSRSRRSLIVRRLNLRRTYAKLRLKRLGLL